MNLKELERFLKMVGEKIKNGELSPESSQLKIEFSDFTGNKSISDEDGIIDEVDHFFTQLSFYREGNSIKQYGRYGTSNLVGEEYNKNRKINNSIKLAIAIPKEKAKEIIKHIAWALNMAGENSKPIEHCLEIECLESRANVFISVFSAKDANVIMQYFRSQPEISQHMLDTSPHFFNNDKVGMFYEGFQSYGKVFIYYLTEYFKDRQKYGKLDCIGVTDFLGFINLKFKNIFKKGRNLNEFLTSTSHGKHGFSNPNREVFLIDFLNNFGFITDLIIEGLSGQNMTPENLQHKIEKHHNDGNIYFNRNWMYRCNYGDEFAVPSISFTPEQKEKFIEIVDTFCFEKFRKRLSDSTGAELSFIAAMLGGDEDMEEMLREICPATPKEETYTDYIRNLITWNEYDNKCPLDRLYSELQDFSLTGSYDAFVPSQRYTANFLARMQDVFLLYGLNLTAENIRSWAANDKPYVFLGRRLLNEGITGPMVTSIKHDIMVDSLKTYAQKIIDFHITSAVESETSCSVALQNAKKDFIELAITEAIKKFDIRPTWQMMLLHHDYGFDIAIRAALSVQYNQSVDKTFPVRNHEDYGKNLRNWGTRKVYTFDPEAPEEDNYLDKYAYLDNLAAIYFDLVAQDMLKDKARHVR